MGIRIQNTGAAPPVWKKLLALAAALMLALTGCGGRKSESIRMDVAQKVYNLDPQFAQSETARLVLSNTVEGLMRYQADGSVVCGMAEAYRVSPSGTIYLFTLREDVKWSNGESITADDFVFTFRRLFNAESPSPYAEDYLMILGAEKALAGEIPAERVSVSAPNDRTVRIELNSPSSSFLELLARPAAAPCNEEFFVGTRARYGLDRASLRSSGPFYISSWDREKSIILSRNRYYYAADEVKCPSVILNFEAGNDKKTFRQRFESGKSDFYQAKIGESLPTGRNIGGFSVENRLWALVFQCENGVFSNRSVRRSFLQAIDRRQIQTSERTPEDFRPSQDFLPEAVRPDGIGGIQDLPCSADSSRSSLEQGIRELGRSSMPEISLLVPRSAGFSQYLDRQGRIPDNTGLGRFTGYLQKEWKDVLFQYVDVEIADDDEFKSRLAQGKFTIAIAPFDAQGEGPEGILGQFSGQGSGNITRYRSEQYDALLRQAALVEEQAEANELYRQAQQLLIEDAAALPLFTQDTYYLTGPGVSGIYLVNGTFSFREAARYN